MKKTLAALSLSLLCFSTLPLMTGCTAVAVAGAVVSTTVGVASLAVKGTVGVTKAVVKGTAAVVDAAIPDGDKAGSAKAKDTKH